MECGACLAVHRWAGGEVPPFKRVAGGMTSPVLCLEHLTALYDVLGGVAADVPTVASGGLVGQKIVEVRPMTDVEAVAEGWQRDPRPPVIVLEDGMRLYSASDVAGYRPGELVTWSKDGELGAVVVE